MSQIAWSLLFLLQINFFVMLVQPLPWNNINDGCGPIICEEPSPAERAHCDIVPQNDHSVPRPSGPDADCCPLWKCWRRNGDFYTVHGVHPGGSETVHYSNNGNSVSSVASGNHDATANAGSHHSGDDIDEALAQIQAALHGIV